MVTCTTPTDATEVIYNFTLNTKIVSNLCKLAIFGEKSSDSTSTVTEENTFAGDKTFDLLSGTSLKVALPTMTYSPPDCCTTTWEVQKAD